MHFAAGHRCNSLGVTKPRLFNKGKMFVLLNEACSADQATPVSGHQRCKMHHATDLDGTAHHAMHASNSRAQEGAQEGALESIEQGILPVSSKAGAIAHSSRAASAEFNTLAPASSSCQTSPQQYKVAARDSGQR